MYETAYRKRFARMVWAVGLALIMACAADAQIVDLSTEFDGDPGPWAATDAATMDLEIRPGWLRSTTTPGGVGTVNLFDPAAEVRGLPLDVYPPPWHFELKFERPTDVPTAIGLLAERDGIQYLFNNLPDTVGVGGRSSFGAGALWPATEKGLFGLPDFGAVPEEAMTGEALELWIGVVDNTTMRYGVRVADSGDDWAFAPDVLGAFDLSAARVSFSSIKLMIECRQSWFSQWPGTVLSPEDVVVDFDYVRFFVDANLPYPPEITDVTTAPGEATIEWDAPDEAPGVTVIGYNVYRSEPAPYERLNTEPLTELEFFTGDLLEGKEYCFVVRSVGDNNYESVSSEPRCDFIPGGEIAGLSTEFAGEMGLWEAADSGETSLDSNPGLLELRTPPGSLGSISIAGGLHLNQYPPPWHFEVSLLRDTTTPTAVGIMLESDGIQYLWNNLPAGTGPDGAVAFGAGAAWNPSGKGIFGLPDFSNISEFDMSGPRLELWIGAINNTTMRYGVRQAGSAAWRFAPEVTGFDLTANPVSFAAAKIVVENRQPWYDQWPGTNLANADAVVELDYIRFFPETPAPSAPQFVSAAAQDVDVTLNWTSPSAVPGVGIVGYNVYQTAPETELLTLTPVGGPPFTAPTFEEVTQYCYHVRAVGDNGLESPDSNTSCATTRIFGDIKSLSTEFDGDSGSWASSDASTGDLTAREGWFRVSVAPGAAGTIAVSGGLPVNIYEPEWHFEIGLERPTDITTAVGFLSDSDGIQYLFNNTPGATGPGGSVAFGAGALFNATEKGLFGAPDFSEVPESAMSGAAIELWIGVIDTQTMRYGVRPAGAKAWNFAPDVIGGFDLEADPVSFASVKIMIENRQSWFDQWSGTVAPQEPVSVDIDYIRFFEGETATPNRPRNVATVAGGSDVTLSWEAPDPAGGVTVAGYNVYKTTPGRVKLNSELLADTHYVAEALVGQTEYCFIVQALGENGFRSADSDEVCATPTDEPPPPPPIEAGLLAFWPLEDGADCSGNERNLDVSVDVFFEPALVGDGLSIPGGGITGRGPAYRDDDAIFNFADNDFTIHLWVNFTVLDGEQVLIEKFTGSGGPGWTLTKLANGSILLFGSGGFGSVTADLPGLVAGSWHQIVARRAGTTVEIFLDAEVVGSKFDVVGTISDSPDGLLVGMRNQGDGRGFILNGVIDELAIWNRALANSDIETLNGDGFGAPGICTTCAATEPDGETSCEDGEDNDCDDAVDGDDSDCEEDAGVGPFIRGDCDGNGQVGGSPTEAIVLLNFSFRGGGEPDCLAACDAEANGSLGITDALRILRHSFLGIGEPDPPFPDCTRSDISSDVGLGCETPIVCP